MQHLNGYPLGRVGLKSLPEMGHHEWLLHTAKFWNSLAGKPHGSIYSSHCILMQHGAALDGCRAAVGSSRWNGAWSMSEAIHASVTGD